jgi:hypothetical protein
LKTADNASLISVVTEKKLNGAEALLNIHPTLNKAFIFEHFSELRLYFGTGNFDGRMSGFGCVADPSKEVRDGISHRHGVYSLPTGFSDARKLTFQGHLTETDTAKMKVTKKRARTSAGLAAVPFADLELGGAFGFDNRRGFSHSTLPMP